MISLVYVKTSYIDYLRTFESRVRFNKGQTRPYIGILFTVNGLKYYAPLSSPKPSHVKMKKNIDVIKIEGGKLGIINLNNMIPVRKNSIIKIDITKEKNPKYRMLLIQQALFFNENEERIIKRATTVYNSFIKGTLPKGVKERCCNFTLLEEKSKLYIEK